MPVQYVQRTHRDGNIIAKLIANAMYMLGSRAQLKSIGYAHLISEFIGEHFPPPHHPCDFVYNDCQLAIPHVGYLVVYLRTTNKSSVAL
jgi:hypothetical protein